MFDKQIAEMFIQTGLKVGENGVLSDGVFVYGRLEGLVLTTPRHEKLDLDDMDSMEFDSRQHCLYVGINGKDEIVEGGPPEGSVFVPPVAVLGDDPESIFAKDIPQTTLDLDQEFCNLFPDSKTQLYYDELKERDMIDMAMLGLPEEGVVPLTDRAVMLYHKEVQRRLRACGYIGKRFPVNQVMDEVLGIEIGSNRRNPFRDWVESHEWDGTPRLRSALIDYFGAAVPSLRICDNVPSDEERLYLETVSQAWFLGAIARMYGPVQHDVVPVFIGLQGGGKGTALRFLAGSDEWYAATTADVANPERFLESVRGAIIVEMGESKQIRGRGVQEDLKAFISQREDRIRKKYARYEETYPRHFILAATANNDSLFTDPTGSRRFYPIYCRPSDAKKEIAVRVRGPALQYEVEQIWAEALHIYRQGAKPYVGKKVDELARIVQSEAAVENPQAEMIEDWVNDPVNGYTEVGSRVYRELILENVFQVDARCPPPNIDRAWIDWVDSNRRWEKCKPFSAKGKTRRGYIRIMEPDARVEVMTLKLVDGDEERYSSPCTASEDEAAEEIAEEPAGGSEGDICDDVPEYVPPSEKRYPMTPVLKPRKVPEKKVDEEDPLTGLEDEDDLSDMDSQPKEEVADDDPPIERLQDLYSESRWNKLDDNMKGLAARKVLRTCMHTHNLKLDDVIPTYHISPSVVGWLMDNGYLYNTGTDANPVYRIGDAP